MVATKREDGLYEVPGLNFAVPYDYVPEAHRPPPEDLYNQAAEAPPPAPDARLAEFQNRTGQPIDLQAEQKQQQESQARTDAVNNLFQRPPTGEQLSSYQHPKSLPANSPKVELEPGPGEHAVGIPSPARTPMDNAFAGQILRANRGGDYSPGGDRLAAQQWLQQNEAVNPSDRKAKTLLTDPETGELQTQLVEHPAVPGVEEAMNQNGLEKISPAVSKAMMPGYEPGTVPGKFSEARHYLKGKEKVHPIGLNYGPGQDASFEAVPVVGTGEQEFQNREARQKMLEAQAADQAQGAMRRDARRDLNAGRAYQEINDKVGQRIDKAEAEYDQQKAELDQVKAQVQQVAKAIPQMAQQMKPPPDTQSRFALAIAQGLMVSGGRPFVNLVRESIQDDFQREQAMMHWALEGQKVQLGTLSTLAHLTSQTRDPVAAAHAFAALRWQQAQHQLEAFQVQTMGGRKSDEAEQMNQQMEVAKQHELKQMLGSVHTRQWATMPASSSGLGGIAGIDRWIDQSFHDPKQRHAVKQHVYGQIAKGEPITMPKFDENGQITRTDERLAEFGAGTAVRLPSWLDMRQPVVHAHDTQEGNVARKALDSAEVAEHDLKEAENIIRKAGARLIPTTRAELEMVMTHFMDNVRQFNGDGTLKIAELPFLEKMTGKDAITNLTNPADAETIINRARQMVRSAAASRAGVNQMTLTPGGTDYWNRGATKPTGSFIKNWGGQVETATEE